MNHFGSSELDFYSLFIIKISEERKNDIRDHNKDVNYKTHIKVCQEEEAKATHASHEVSICHFNKR